MSELLLLRHGQASFGQADYDRLSPLGHQQCRAVGEHWLRLGLGWDRVVIGALRRHAESFQALAAPYRDAGIALPEPEVMPEFNEHQGLALVAALAPEARELARSTAAVDLAGPDAEAEARRRTFFQRYRELLLGWVEGRLAVPGVETWSDFRARVQQGVARVLDPGAAARRTLVVTSGGTASSVAGHSLGLGPAQVLELSLMLRNAAAVRFKHGSRGLSLAGFNELPGLDRPEYITYV